MKITIYELLGMVKDGKTPKKIKWGDTKYTIYTDEFKKTYYQDDECKYFFLEIKCLDDLNDEIEILEEEKKIPEKLPKSVTDNACSSKDDRLIANTINEIIDYLDYIKSKGDE